MAEQRKSSRISFREGVQYTVNIENSGHLLSCNLSQGGIRCYSNDFIPLMTSMALTFFLKAEQMVNIDGRVVWVHKVPHAENYQVGIEFPETDLNANSMQQIHHFVKSHHD